MGNRFCNTQCNVTHCKKACTLSVDEYGDFEDAEVEQSCAFNPVGAVFEETLEDLSLLDKELLLFCAGMNVVAVRWLIMLGADKGACDMNGTSALHVACRSGSLSIVQELLRQGVAHSCDRAGWTPLHISVFMCRHDVTLALLQSHPPLDCRTTKGHVPLDLCSDHWSRDIIQCYALHMFRNHAEKFVFDLSGVNMSPPKPTGKLKDLQYEPFFIKRDPVFTVDANRAPLLEIGARIFNEVPGGGLAFMVASGEVRDSPTILSKVLRRALLSRAKVGEFLGESFSMSQMIRHEFVNIVDMRGLGIVSSLAKVFSLLQIPKDLQKIDRLVECVAAIWWRQHDDWDEHTDSAGSLAQYLIAPLKGDQNFNIDDRTGAELKDNFNSADTLHQLMFSVIMLHWILYTAGGAHVMINSSQWLSLNKGIGSNDNDLPTDLLMAAYETVQSRFFKALAIDHSCGEADEYSPCEPNVLGDLCDVEGWGWVVGSPLTVADSLKGDHIVTVSDIFSEVPLESGRCQMRGLLHPANQDKTGFADRIWLSLCKGILFFSANRGTAPYACVSLRSVELEMPRPDSSILTFVDLMTEEDQVCLPKGCDVEWESALVVVFLLPDGRWQEAALPRLDLEIANWENFLEWDATIRQFCGTLL